MLAVFIMVSLSALSNRDGMAFGLLQERLTMISSLLVVALGVWLVPKKVSVSISALVLQYVMS